MTPSLIPAALQAALSRLPELHLPQHVRADVPVVPGAGEARRWARDELVRKVYQDAKPGWAERLFALLKKAFSELLNKIGVADANIGLAVVAGLALVAVIAVVLIVRPRLNRRKTSAESVFAGESVLTAAQHRAMARDAAATGDFHTAVSESFRAIVRSAEERDVSVPALGRTALEIVADLERAFPQHGAALARSAELFNAVRYGSVPPTAEMYREVLAADTATAAATPVYDDAFTAVLA